MKTKVLILYTSVGHGIKTTAQNIFEELSGSEQFETKIEDIQKIEAGHFTSAIEKIYLSILDNFSFIWGFLYTSKLVLVVSLPVRKFIARFKSSHTLQLLRGYQPAIVICTQTAATGIMAYLKSKGLYRGKLVAVFSDYHLHRFWLYDEVDLYVCAIEEQVTQLLALGTPKEKIVLTGMFIAKKFYNQIPKDEAKQTLGLLVSMPVVLMTSGARVRNETKDTFLKLLRSPKSFQVVVVCGFNQQLKQELSEISAPDNHPVKLFGYVEDMDVLMAASDVLIGKPGGPTISEAVVKQLPMILTGARPGHEMINLDYLVSNRIVDYARIPRESLFLVEQILEGKIKKNWTAAFEKLIKSRNSQTIIQALDKKAAETSGISVKNYQENVDLT